MKIANAEGDPILSAWLPDALALLERAPKPTQDGTKTVYCVAIEGGSFGGVDWYHDAANRSDKHLDAYFGEVERPFR
ncbi:hypothetical protein [Burkholderia contaminans]|uniref:Uncharacterized protein n=2 Tax=Burkholderia contaminans TaxID=488447 RepID=A0A250LLF8_9BURK|nr:hypothetical protein [Burkholderia contaminans]KKL36308.1 hypothetical protein WR31_24145 [Burkholderia contaminans LMG 23361]MBA9934354.1 hypothetical protein [Burkholderia contaminans]BBA45382.1 hypothetical protein BCCH1_78930 [Burkholderia contaminans]